MSFGLPAVNPTTKCTGRLGFFAGRSQVDGEQALARKPTE